MPTKPKVISLPNPSVFKNASTDQWVCEYYEFDERGKPKARRKSFVRELKRQGKEATSVEQRTAALAMQEEILASQREQERITRREREQTHLTARQLREAKAAFAIFDQIPNRNKSLVDAAMLYRDHLRLEMDSPPLSDCIAIFLERKKEAADKELLSQKTYKTLKQRLNHCKKYFTRKSPGIKIGEVTDKHLIAYFDELDVSERTRRNYFTDIANFFNDASDPKDEHRFLNKNPMDGVIVHFRKLNGTGSFKTSRKERKTPAILQLEASRHVLKVAFERRKHGMLGFTVCGLFLCMRPSEVFDLVKQEDYWNRFVKLDEGVLRVDGFGKMNDQRIIVMPEVAKAWLRFIKDEGLPLCFPYNPNGRNQRYATFRAWAFLPEEDARRLITLRQKVKIGYQMTPEDEKFAERCRIQLREFEDILRHTGGTNLYYANGFDKHKTVEQMGHSAEIFVEHYRGLLNSPKDAEAFHALLPETFVS